MRVVAFIVFLLFLAYALVARWYFVCQIRGLCEEKKEVVDQRLRTLTLQEGDTVLLRDYDQFAFDSASVAPRLNDNNNVFLDTVAVIMNADTTKSLTITGRFREGEKDLRPGGFFENIGVARADRIRRLLMQRGIPERRITLDQAMSPDPLLREPVAFELYRASAIPSDYEKVQFVFNNMTFSDANFAYNSDEFRPGEAFVLYADSVKTYLGFNTEKVMTIIGHTDSIGSDRFNDDLGMRRAISAREYFRELGVKATIKVESKGKRRPVASNNSAEGRQKNRRVNFVLE